MAERTKARHWRCRREKCPPGFESQSHRTIIRQGARLDDRRNPVAYVIKFELNQSKI